MDSSLIALPRRHMIGCSMASLAFGGAALAQGSEAFEPLPAKISVSANHLTIPVRINGKGPFRFVIDTGADRSVIAEDIAIALGLPFGNEVMLQGIVLAIPAKSVPVSELEYGVASRENLRLPVLPRRLLQADGYLGLDAIGQYRVVFDFKAQTLQVLESISSAAIVEIGGFETHIRAPGSDGHLRSVQCRVDGVRTVAFLDSGAEVSAGNPALMAALVEQDPGRATTRDIELTGITGGSSKGKVAQIRKIDFADLEFSGCEIAIADLDVFRVWELQDKPAMLIGLNFLRQFHTVIIDYRRKEFSLRLTRSAWVAPRRA